MALRVSVLRSLVTGPRLRAALAAGVSGTGAFRALDRLLGRLQGGFILAFHNLPPERFVEHVQALAPNQPVALGDLVARQLQGKATGGLFAITVDDGVGDTVRTLSATCVQRAWPVTFFLPTAYLDDPAGMPFQWLKAVAPLLPAERVSLPSGALDLSPPGARRAFLKRMQRVMYTRPRADYVPILVELMAFLVRERGVDPDRLAPPAGIGWAEVRDLARNPLVAFESHGISHAALSALAPTDLERELRDSRATIETHTGRPCEHFCYPFGGPESIGGEAPAAVARFYRSAVTMTRGRVGRHHPHLLPRIPLYPEDDGAVARLKVLTV